MVSAVAHLELAFLCLLTLCLALLDTPVPRAWALAGGALVVAQTAALGAIGFEPFTADVERSEVLIGSGAEAVAVLVVPALTAAFLVLVFWHCARAYARARRRLEAARGRS